VIRRGAIMNSPPCGGDQFVDELALGVEFGVGLRDVCFASSIAER
jgi:hypothetical protein